MRQILIFGAGRSATTLIRYLLDQSQSENWKVIVADNQIELADKKINGHERGEAVFSDINDIAARESLIEKADIVISMLPVKLHFEVAKTCLKLKKNLVTASYMFPDLEKLRKEVEDAGIIFLMECGLDPGLDHMSAMKILDQIRDLGGEMKTFETFTGGLLAPHPDENPWQYKFTWNPRNVVLAGQGGVKFIQEGKYKYIPYHKIFRRTEIVYIPGYGHFEGYANRDSLKYLELYNLHGIKTLYRGTFRRPGFCRAWDVFVQLGATDDTYQMEGVRELTHKQFINAFLSYNPYDSVELKLAYYMNLDYDSQEMFRLRWLNLFEDEMVGLDKGSPAQILEHILKKKWTLDEDDIDMIVMWHKFEYFEGNKLMGMHSHFVARGEDREHTAMAKTVGLPVGIAAKLILNKRITLNGIHIPIKKEIYNPILAELEDLGVKIVEKEPTEIKMPGKNL